MKTKHAVKVVFELDLHNKGELSLKDGVIISEILQTHIENLLQNENEQDLLNEALYECGIKVKKDCVFSVIPTIV